MGLVIISMTESRKARIPNFTGAEAASLTQQGNDYLFRASFSQTISMPRVARYIAEQAQLDFSSVVVRARQANADVLFPYLHEEEFARLLRELRKQAYDRPIIDETNIVNQKVIELAAGAADGVKAHVGLTADSDKPLIRAFDEQFVKEHGYRRRTTMHSRDPCWTSRTAWRACRSPCSDCR